MKKSMLITTLLASALNAASASAAWVPAWTARQAGTLSIVALG